MLKLKAHLGLDATVTGRRISNAGRPKIPGSHNRLPKERRAEIADGKIKIGAVKDIQNPQAQR